jgi:quaternary ammonium compound-resistance protein SugE
MINNLTSRDYIMSWVYLILAGIFEVGFGISLKLMNGHKNIPWTITFYLCIACSFFFMNLAIRAIPLGTAYAVWTGIGTAGVVIAGFCFLNETVTVLRVTFLSLLLLSIVGLKFTS